MKKHYMDLIHEHDTRYGELMLRMMDRYGTINTSDLTVEQVKEFYETEVADCDTD